MNYENIKCPNPKCGWQPDATSEWICSECGTTWNTFDTGGVCPNPECPKVYTHTQCLDSNCGTWSKFDDWFIKPEIV